MGLDMYLQAEHYVSDYDEKGQEITRALQSVDADGLQNFRPSNITFDLCTWRKANAIHGWFVRELQDGEDKCQKTYVPLEKLQELKEVCEKVLDDPSLANRLLPVTAGFFFGGKDYDEYYLGQVEKTLVQLKKILSLPEAKNWWITYQASW